MPWEARCRCAGLPACLPAYRYTHAGKHRLAAPHHPLPVVQTPTLFSARLLGRLQVKGQLLRELLVESKAYGYLLGSGGAAGEGGALARFVPDARERGRVLEAVAHECSASAQASPRRQPGQPGQPLCTAAAAHACHREETTRYPL